MKYDAKEFKKYPEIMNKEQMRIACHISKQTALYAGMGSTSRTHGGKSHTARRSQSHGRNRLGAPAPP